MIKVSAESALLCITLKDAKFKSSEIRRKLYQIKDKDKLAICSKTFNK
jgi:hypothetical protein